MEYVNVVFCDKFSNVEISLECFQGINEGICGIRIDFFIFLMCLNCSENLVFINYGFY